MASSVQRKMAAGAAWMVGFKLLERTLGLASTLILVRLLVPHDFGLVAMALSFVAMAEVLTAFGFDTALIQNRAAAEAHYHTAWTCNVLVGAAICLVMLAAALPVAAFYGEDEVSLVLACLALGPLIGGCENVGVVAFRKELRFRSEFAFQLSRKLAGFLVAVPLAFALRNYWALVAGMLASRLSGTVVSYFAHPFRPRFSLVGAAGLFAFSKWLLLNNALAFLKERMTDFVIGRSQGPTALGLYNVSYEIANLPTSELGAPINRALLPGFSQIADDPAPLRAAYLNAMGVLALFALPAAAGILALAGLVVPVILGTKWLACVPLMQVLALFGAVQLFHSSMASLLIAIGRPSEVVKANALFIVLLALLLAVLVGRFAALGAAWAVVVAAALSTPAFLAPVRAQLGVGAGAFLRALARPLIASTAMVLLLRAAIPGYDASMTTLHAAALLAAAIALGAAVYAGVLVALWLAWGRPAGAERTVLELARSALRSRLPWLAR